MKKSFDLARVLAIGGVLFTGTIVIGDGTRFSDFIPLGSSAGPAADESQPITFGKAAFGQLRHARHERDGTAQGPLSLDGI